MIKTDSGYIEGSLARKPIYDVYERNPVLKTKRSNKAKNKAKVRLVLYILVLFSLAFVLLYRYTSITELNYKLAKAQTMYEEISDDNSRLKIDIERSTDLESIRIIAEEGLGMQKPDKAQIVYVSVPKQDMTVVSQEYSSGLDDNHSLFAVIINRVLEFLNLIA